MNRKLIFGALILALAAIAAAGCAALSPQAEPTGTPIGIANPASVYCEQNGGKLEIRTGEDGGQVGICVFADGSECEEFAFMNGECAPGQPPAAEGEAAPSTGPVAPLSAEACEALRAGVGAAVGVEATSAEVPFRDPFDSSLTGSACMITVKGTGADFSDFGGLAASLRAMLEGDGWSEDQQYMADGPTGTATAYRKGEDFAMVSVGWSPSEDANCPPDHPISTCDLAPEQQLYEIQVTAARVPAGGADFTGTYSATLPAASGPGRLVNLTLSPDQSALMVTDYQNGQPPIVEAGTWSAEGGSLTVTFTTIDEQPQNNVITFQLQGGTLVATAYDTDLYGSEGLQLQKQ